MFGKSFNSTFTCIYHEITSIKKMEIKTTFSSELTTMKLLLIELFDVMIEILLH